MESKKTILIVEDDGLLQQLLSQQFIREGFATETASTAAQALALLEHKSIDLVVLDLLLPEVDGFEFLKTVRASAKSQAPIVVLSNIGKEEEIQRARDLGAKEFITKAQYTPDQIVQKIKALL